MAVKGKEQPVIIVKKRRAGHHGHHGGAWKVAYADFVTAMMAFFLVMWLVGQDSQVKASVAGYFREPGVFEHEMSTSMLAGGTPGMEPGKMPDAMTPKPDPNSLERERTALASAAKAIQQKLLDSSGVANLRNQIQFNLSPEGLRIELVEEAGSSFFDNGSAVLKGESIKILKIIASEISALQNGVALEGHTDRRPYVNGDRYGNWELSADRANAARREMQAGGLTPQQIRMVRGLADTQLHNEADALDPRNRRVSIVVRSQEAAAIEAKLSARK